MTHLDYEGSAKSQGEHNNRSRMMVMDIVVMMMTHLDDDSRGQGGKGEHKAAVVVTTRRVCLDRTHPDTFVETNMNFKIQRQILKGTKTSSRDKYKLEKTKANKKNRHKQAVSRSWVKSHTPQHFCRNNDIS